MIQSIRYMIYGFKHARRDGDSLLESFKFAYYHMRLNGRYDSQNKPKKEYKRFIGKL